AVVDLRSVEGPYRLRQNETLRVDVDLLGLSLVEGEYKLGLYVESNLTSGNRDNLGWFEVLPARQAGRTGPYPPEVRGYLELASSMPRYRVECHAPVA